MNLNRKVGTWLNLDVLVGKFRHKIPKQRQNKKLLRAIFGGTPRQVKETSLCVTWSYEFLDRRFNCTSKIYQRRSECLNHRGSIYLFSPKRRLQIGDKVAGRHGNKGIGQTFFHVYAICSNDNL